MTHCLTSKENIVLNLIFECIGENRFNRTPEDYVRIALKLPKLEALLFDVNAKLRKIAAAGQAPFEICYFKKGDAHPWYEPYPESVSITTIRMALVKSGMNELRKRKH